MLEMVAWLVVRWFWVLGWQKSSEITDVIVGLGLFSTVFRPFFGCCVTVEVWSWSRSATLGRLRLKLNAAAAARAVQSDSHPLSDGWSIVSVKLRLLCLPQFTTSVLITSSFWPLDCSVLYSVLLNSDSFLHCTTTCVSIIWPVQQNSKVQFWFWKKVRQQFWLLLENTTDWNQVGKFLKWRRNMVDIFFFKTCSWQFVLKEHVSFVVFCTGVSTSFG